MLWSRLIPVLLIHKGGLWKTEQFRPHTYLGDPTNAVRIFNEKEVDELIVLDIDADKEGRGPDYTIIERLASECFMPLCYGGGVTNLGQSQELFRRGVEKIAVNSALSSRPELITEIAEFAGSQAIVVSLDLVRINDQLLLFQHSTGTTSQTDWLALIRDYCQRGAGEVMINAVHRDGTLAGPDLSLIHLASQVSSIPLIATGGARNLSDAAAMIDAGASAVAAGAMFVYRGRHRAVLITYPDMEKIRAENLMD